MNAEKLRARSRKMLPHQSQQAVSGRSRRRWLLPSLLVVAVLAWWVTLPIQRRMLRETDRLNREADTALALRMQQRQAADRFALSRQAVLAEPRASAPRLAYAAQLQQAGDLAGAEAQLQAGLKASPNSAELHAALGEIYDGQHKEDRGIVEYRRALALDARNVHALKNLAMRYVALGWNRLAAQLVNRRSGRSRRSRVCMSSGAWSPSRTEALMRPSEICCKRAASRPTTRRFSRH